MLYNQQVKVQTCWKYPEFKSLPAHLRPWWETLRLHLMALQLLPHQNTRKCPHTKLNSTYMVQNSDTNRQNPSRDDFLNVPTENMKVSSSSSLYSRASQPTEGGGADSHVSFLLIKMGWIFLSALLVKPTSKEPKCDNSPSGSLMFNQVETTTLDTKHHQPLCTTRI